MTRHAPRSRFERIMRERVLAAHLARPGDVENVVLDAARCTTGAPVWWTNKHHLWRLFTGWGETYSRVRANPRPGGFEL